MPPGRLYSQLNSRRLLAHLACGRLAVLSVLLQSGFRHGLRVLYRDHQSIAAPRQRLDVPGIIRGIPQRTPQALDCRVDAVVKIHNRVIGPQLALDFLAGDDISATLHQ